MVTQLEALIAQQKIERKLLHINQALDRAVLKEPNAMVDPKIAALITQFDNATDKIAARIQALIDNGSLNAESQAALQAEADKLNLLGQDPNNPVPPQAA